MATLLPFHTQLANAWKLFLHRWGVAVVLQLLALIPGVLLYPLVVEYRAAIDNGVDPTVVFQTSMYVTQFLIGFILLILLGVFIAASTGILFAAQEKLSFYAVVKATLVRYVPVLYTSILAAFAVVVSLIPALALNYWYTTFALGGIMVAGGGIAAVNAIMLIAIVALLIPAAIVATWVMYAPLVTALKSAPAGFTALMSSKNLVQGHIWQVFWRMFGSLVLYQVVSMSVGSLPYASYLVPFILSIIIIAFFVELYKELQEHEG